MHKKLLLMAFEKVRCELIDKGDSSPSINKCAIRLSEIVSEDFVYGPKSLRTLNKKAIKNEGGNFNIPQPEVVRALAKYLKFQNYEEFVLNNEDTVQEKIDDGGLLLISQTDGTAQEGGKSVDAPKQNNVRKMLIAFASVFLIVIAISVYLFIDRPKWMVWNGASFEVISFDPELEKNGVLNVYNEDNFLHLKKIIPTCETKFFNGDGSERIWYGKNSNKEYEFFTALGKHPETGKTLRPITGYIIGKYICP